MICRICGNSWRNRSYRVKEMMFGLPEYFDYFQCSACDCLQIAEIPTHMDRYYPKNYYTTFVKGSSIKTFLLNQRDNYGFTHKGILGRLVFFLFPNPGLEELAELNLPLDCRILDVGCGPGFNLQILWRHGFLHAMGIDPFIEKDIVRREDLGILKKTIDSIEGKWDVVMFHHSFEHMANPLETLKKVSAILTPSGVCLLRIPIVSSYAWHHYGLSWVQLDAPRHFYLHSIKSLNIIAEQAGFRVKKICYDSTDFQFWGSEQYQKNIPLMAKQSYLVNPLQYLFSWMHIKKYKKKASQLNLEGQGDQAAFILTR